MARSVLVSLIMTRARRWADMESDTDFVSDAELLDYVDAAWTRLYSLYVKAWPERFQTTATITTVAGTSTYALPTDWFGTIAVDVLTGTQYSALRHLQEEERNDFQTSTGAPVGFRVIGSNVQLFPTPGAVYSLRHTYVPTATAITLSSQSIDGVLGHERMIELDVALRLKAKEESDGSALFAEYQRMRVEVEEEAQMRLISTPRTIAMTERPYWYRDTWHR